MRRILIVLVMVVQAVAARASNDRDSAVQISVVTSWADKLKLKNVCGKKTRGCTRFSSNRLIAVCSAESPEEWALRASAIVVAVMVLPRPGAIYQAAARNHEDLHVADIEDDLSGYIADLHTRRFSSQSECEDVGREESDRFRERVADFALKSTKRRD